MGHRPYGPHRLPWALLCSVCDSFPRHFQLGAGEHARSSARSKGQDPGSGSMGLGNPIIPMEVMPRAGFETAAAPLRARWPRGHVSGCARNMAAAVVQLLLLLLPLPVVAGGGGRKVSLQYNPGWNGSSVNVLHVRAVGAADTLHYVWSSIGGPAVLLLATRGSTSALGIDWTRLLSPDPAGAVWIEPPGSVTHAAAVVFTKVFEYSEAGAQEELFYPTYDLSNFTWASINHTLNHTALTAEFSGVPALDPGGSFSNGSLAFRVTAYEAGGRDEALPSLLHTANSSKVEFVLAGVAPRGNGSRFALEVAAVEEPGLAPALRALRSIDDEYTPTVFEVLSLAAQARNESSARSFLQWKATAYGSRWPRREDRIRCHSQGLRAANWSLLTSSLVRAYFGTGAGSSYSVSAVNISFGGEEGKVYEEKRFLSWSALLGFGQPPQDTFSPLVISIMAVALGTPVLLLLLGGCVLLCARRQRYSEYEPIN